jgi:hypothetical protein
MRLCNDKNIRSENYFAEVIQLKKVDDSLRNNNLNSSNNTNASNNSSNVNANAQYAYVPPDMQLGQNGKILFFRIKRK